MFGQPRVGHRLRVGAVGDLAAHLNQRGGIQHANHLLDRQQLPLGQLVAALQRHHILGPHQVVSDRADSEDEAPNARDGVDKRTVLRLDPRPVLLDHRRRRPIIALTGVGLPGGSSSAVLRDAC